MATVRFPWPKTLPEAVCSATCQRCWWVTMVSSANKLRVRAWSLPGLRARSTETGDMVTNAPTNSSPEDIAGWAAALDQAMQASGAIQAQATGTSMSAPDPESWPALPGPIARGQH